MNLASVHTLIFWRLHAGGRNKRPNPYCSLLYSWGGHFKRLRCKQHLWFGTDFTLSVGGGESVGPTPVTVGGKLESVGTLPLTPGGKPKSAVMRPSALR